MHIAQIAPLIETVPPGKYGGSERVIALLAEGLVRRGHQVTLFAPADSRTSASVVPCSAKGLRAMFRDLKPEDSAWHQMRYQIAELGEVIRRLDEFDIVHSHLDVMGFPLAALSLRPVVSTAHGRLDLTHIRRVYDAFPNIPLVAVSRDQRSYLPNANWVGVVYNGIRMDTYTFNPNPGKYLMFLGRMSPEKRPDRAIELAIRVGMQLILAAKVDPAEQDYFETVIRPLLKHPLVEFIGEVDDAEKNELLGGAWAYLFPIDWPEPFGITMVEAMACGTPVVATCKGAVPEIVMHGMTGFIGNCMDDLEHAIEQVGKINRGVCRRWVEMHFSDKAMAGGYERVYCRLISKSMETPTATVFSSDFLAPQSEIRME